jgi:hypothetical protein
MMPQMLNMIYSEPFARRYSREKDLIKIVAKTNWICAFSNDFYITKETRELPTT